MQLTIVAVGRMRRGPEPELVSDYLDRTTRLGKRLALSPARLIEVEARRGTGPEAEASAIYSALPAGALRVCLDERGTQMSSPDFAARLGAWRDAGIGDAAFIIGGADGLSPEIRATADHCLSFGAMVWPHMLVRVMLAEQLYRGVSILAGTPYHRT
jgi:23S rRNA (pseudouridine1915-N3)-methyltransferase